MERTSTFAICVVADKDMLLTPRKIYQVIPDDAAERTDHIRVIDDEGEDYLYPKEYFVFVPVSRDIETAILKAA
jgi:hypothetical protein